MDAGEFVLTDVYGTFVLLDALKASPGIEFFLHVSTDEVYGSREAGFFKETDPLNPSSPYAASKAGADRLAYAYRVTYGAARHHRPAEQQLRPVSVSGEVHPPVRHQCPGGPAAAPLREGDERPGLALCRRQLPGHRPRRPARRDRRSLQHRRRQRGPEYPRGGGDLRPPGPAAQPDHPGPRPPRPRRPVCPRLRQAPGARLGAGGRRSTTPWPRPSAGTGTTRTGGGRSRTAAATSSPSTRRITKTGNRAFRGGCSPKPPGASGKETPIWRLDSSCLS